MASDFYRLRNRSILDLLKSSGYLPVRVRDGLMGAPDPVAMPDSGSSFNPVDRPLGREEILTKALLSVFTQDGIRIRLDPLFAASRPSQKKKLSPFVRAALDIDSRDLVVDIGLAVFDEEGTQVGAANKAFTLEVSKEKAADLARAGLRYTLDVALSRLGSYQVRAVRDATSGEVGSAYAFLDVPDFNQSKISLSSLVLSLPPGAASRSARPSWNEFAPGTTVQYVCEVFGLKTPGKPPVPPNVESEVKLYRGGGSVAEFRCLL